MIPPDGSTLSIEHGPSGHGVRAVGWDTDAPPRNGAGKAGSPQQWPLRSLADPSAPSLRFRIRVPIVLNLPAGSKKHNDATVKRHEVGEGNPGLSYSTTFSPRAKGVITIAEFIKRVRRQGDSFLLFPAPACRTATITLSATDTNDAHKVIMPIVAAIGTAWRMEHGRNGPDDRTSTQSPASCSIRRFTGAASPRSATAPGRRQRRSPASATAVA